MRILYLVYAPCVAIFLWFLRSESLTALLVLKAMALFSLFAAIWMLFRLPWARWIALAAFLPLMVALAYGFATSIAFAWQNPDFDCPTCDGSPMAFLFGYAVMLLLFAPGAFLCIWLLRKP